jgi:hypothetical protein
MSDIRQAASEYLGSYVTEAFDLSHLEWLFIHHEMSYDKDEALSAKQKYAYWAHDLAQHCAEARVIAEKFMAQLVQLTTLRPINFKFLTGRLKAALTYFDPRFAHFRTSFENHLSTVTAVKGTKAYQNEIRDLADACAAAQQTMHKSLAMVEAVIANQEFTRESIQKLEINHHQSLKPLIPKEPVVPRVTKAEKKKRIKNPKLLSTHLFLAGTTIEQIAGQLGVKETTVQDHLAWGVKAGLIPIHKLMAQPDVDEIIACSETLGADQLNPIKAALNDKYDYRTLRLAMAHKAFMRSGCDTSLQAF